VYRKGYFQIRQNHWEKYVRSNKVGKISVCAYIKVAAFVIARLQIAFEKTQASRHRISSTTVRKIRCRNDFE
jgi:hypothetical protein